MRPYTRQLQPPCDMTIGQIVAKVVEIKHKDFPENCIVLASVGWVKTGKNWFLKSILHRV